MPTSSASSRRRPGALSGPGRTWIGGREAWSQLPFWRHWVVRNWPFTCAPAAIRESIRTKSRKYSSTWPCMRAFLRPTNALDPVLQRVPDDRRATLLARREPGGATVIYRFDIILQGAGETAFFNL